MDFTLAQIATDQWPDFFAVFAGAVGALGCIAAFVAHVSTSRDRSAIKNAGSMLSSSESWEGAHTYSEHELSEWFRNRTIHPESGVADVIRACWSAWLGSRSISLTELHVLVARRERSKVAVQLSAGIAALLLVIGIVGTLCSVKPILKALQFKGISVSANTELINRLMSSLGDAFEPSLVALVFTIIVVAFRGIYSLSLQRYTLELDRFAMGTVMPHYRPRSISEEYEDVRSAFCSLAKTMADRDSKFDKVIIQLTKFVDSVSPTLDGLNSGIDNMTIAADALAKKSSSIAETLTRTLGKKSPLYAAVNGFEGIFSTTNERLDQLSQHINRIKLEQHESRKAMLRTLDEIAEVFKQISGDHQSDRDNVSKNIADLKTVVEKIPANLLESTRRTFDDGMALMQSALKESLDKQSKQTEDVYKHTRSKTQDTLELISQSLTATTTRINDSVNAIPVAVDMLNESLNRNSFNEKAAADAIDSIVQEAKFIIRSSYEDVAQKQSTTLASAPANILISEQRSGRLTDFDTNPNPHGEPPQTTVAAPSEHDHGERGRGFFGGFFGGRKS